MNNRQMMEQRVDQLRFELDRLNQEETNIQGLKALVLEELLMVRRQLTRMDKGLRP